MFVDTGIHCSSVSPCWWKPMKMMNECFLLLKTMNSMHERIVRYQNNISDSVHNMVKSNRRPKDN